MKIWLWLSFTIIISINTILAYFVSVATASLAEHHADFLSIEHGPGLGLDSDTNVLGQNGLLFVFFGSERVAEYGVVVLHPRDLFSVLHEGRFW